MRWEHAAHQITKVGIDLSIELKAGPFCKHLSADTT